MQALTQVAAQLLRENWSSVEDCSSVGMEVPPGVRVCVPD